MGSTKYTFWSLLNEYTIEIPIIQRDYAQGRNSQKVNEIRNNFLDNLYVTLKNGHHLDFDFVYGSLKSSNSHTKFIPLDGQQRLTTLFLLHWFLALKDYNQLDEEKKSYLTKFSYETRTSSRDFCSDLVRNGIDASDLDNSSNKISEVIKNSSWFFLSWERDPTVKSMLNMLDSIQSKFSDCEGGFELLINHDNPLITFQFIKLDNFGLTDSLYIKMNARGKPLTDFENFKAKFEQFLEIVDKEKNTCYRLEFVDKIDGDWTDLFWSYKEDFLIDKPFMRYLHFITEMLFYLKGSNDLELEYVGISPKIGFEVIEEVYKDKSNIEFLFRSFGFFQKLDGISDYFDGIFTSKNYSVNKTASFLDDNNLFVKCIKDKSFGIPEKALLFVIIDHNLKSKPNINNSDLVDLIRVIRNLLSRVRQQNQTNYNSNLRVDTLEVIIPEISNKLIGGRNIYEELLTPALTVNGFSKESLAFEIEKAVIIKNHIALREVIFELEDNPLLQGSIHNFDLNENLSNLTELYYAFKEIWSLNNDSLIIRGILSITDYSISTGGSALGQKWYFGNSPHWYTILTHTNSWLKNILPQFLKSYLGATGTSIEEKLAILIGGTLQKYIDRDWRFYFLKYPDMINSKISVYTWKYDNANFELRNIEGNYLTSWHINPYVRTVARLIAEKEICSMNKCYGIHGDESPLRLNNGVELYCLENGWKVFVPSGFALKKELFVNFDFTEIENTHYLLKDDTRDRIEVAFEFCIEITSTKG